MHFWCFFFEYDFKLNIRTFPSWIPLKKEYCFTILTGYWITQWHNVLKNYSFVYMYCTYIKIIIISFAIEFNKRCWYKLFAFLFCSINTIRVNLQNILKMNTKITFSLTKCTGYSIIYTLWYNQVYKHCLTKFV
jgi:hypothetical protein